MRSAREWAIAFALAVLLTACGRNNTPPSGKPPPEPTNAPFEVTLDDDPLQIGADDLDEELSPWDFRGFRIIPLARFEIEGRVLGAEHYRFDEGAKLVPVDLAMGWGPMTRDEVLEKIEISQSGRFYFWRTDAFPIPRRDIETHSANMHLIPANALIEHTLKEIEKNDRVRFRGYLVRAEGPNGWLWKSSLTRQDTGNGACELVWVETLEKR